MARELPRRDVLGGEHVVLKIPVDFSKSRRKDWGDIAFSVRAETDSTQDKFEKNEKRLKIVNELAEYLNEEGKGTGASLHIWICI